jgi:uncharacterized membrane protein YoaK (UPF0700 family)
MRIVVFAMILTCVSGALAAFGVMASWPHLQVLLGALRISTGSIGTEAVGLTVAGLGALLLFLTGVVCGGAVVARGRLGARRREVSTPSHVEGALLVWFGAFAISFGDSPGSVVFFLALVCFLAGFQNAVVTELSKGTVGTTQVVGILTCLGIAVGEALDRISIPRSERPAVEATRPLIVLNAQLLGCFVLGAFVGIASFRFLGLASCALLAIPLFVAGERSRGWELHADL